MGSISHLLTTEIEMEPGRPLANLNKSSKMEKYLFASDWSATESRTGWPPPSHEILNTCALLATAIAKAISKDDVYD